MGVHRMWARPPSRPSTHDGGPAAVVDDISGHAGSFASLPLLLSLPPPQATASTIAAVVATAATARELAARIGLVVFRICTG